MATISLTVPDALVPILVEAAEEYLVARGIDISGLTALQKGRRYLALVLHDVVVQRKVLPATADAQTAIDAARAAAEVEADGIT